MFDFAALPVVKAGLADVSYFAAPSRKSETIPVALWARPPKKLDRLAVEGSVGLDISTLLVVAGNLAFVLY